MHTLIFSPHRGTAALSLPIAIPYWLSRGYRVTMVTVFSRSLEAPFSDADTVHANDRLMYVSAMRRKEDEQFQRLHPKLAMLELNLKDAAIRHRLPAEEAASLAASPTDPAIEKIQKALAKLVEQAGHPIDVVALPLGAGGHLDHRVVRDAVLTAESGTALPVVFYEDQPGASQAAEWHVETLSHESVDAKRFGHLQAMQVPVMQNEVVDHRGIRARTLAMYASQIDDELAAGIAGYAARQGDFDRLWVAAEMAVSPVVAGLG